MLVPGGMLSAHFCPALGVDIPCFCSQQQSEGSFLCWVELDGFDGDFLPFGGWTCPIQGTAQVWTEQPVYSCDHRGAGNGLLLLCSPCYASLMAGFHLVPAWGVFMVGVHRCLRHRAGVGSLARELCFRRTESLFILP